MAESLRLFRERHTVYTKGDKAQCTLYSKTWSHNLAVGKPYGP